MPQTTLSSRGQVVFPSEFRNEDGLKPGETFEVERTKAGEYLFRRKKRGSQGLLAALLEFQKIAPGAELVLPDWSHETTETFKNPFE